MSFTERLREKVYWSLDYLKGRPVGKYYDDAREAYEIGVLTTETNKKIEKLLCHAVETTDFYKERFDGKSLNLQDFPVMNKELYRQNYEACCSSLYKDAKDNRIMQTSGSTGTPFEMVQNKDKIHHNTASALFINSLGGYQLGDRQAFLRVWVKGCNKSSLAQKMENLIPIDTSNMDEQHLAEILKLLKDKKVTSVIGYASSLVALSEYIQNSGLDTSQFGINSFIAISEHMPNSAKDQLMNQFKCSVNSQYSNEENGIMAIQQDGEDYYFESSGWYLEILKMDSDELADEGELGRVVITDLYNYAFPIIRYDNGDTAIAQYVYTNKESFEERYKVYLKELYGRRVDVVYDLEGKPVSPYVMTNHMWGIEGIRQWKFVQRDEFDYCFYINGDESMDTSVVTNKFKKYFGDNISVEFVDEIPVLASGKRRYIECLWRKNS